MGDKCPADVRLVLYHDFALYESSLSGAQTQRRSYQGLHLISEIVKQAFMGTMVVGGRASGLVVATGDKTQFGQVILVSDWSVCVNAEL